jgi:cell division protein FtsQ
MAETIRRNARPVRRQGAGRGSGKGGRAAPRSRGSIADALMRVLPFTEEQLHKLFLALILAALAALAWLIASLAGLPQLAGAMLAQEVEAAGFEVRHVEVRGIERMNELAVYERVLGVRDRAMPLVDLAALRASLLELPWVRDARISRQLPDTIVVDIVEREPHAVLRTGADLALIDRTGRVLERVSPQAARGRLVVSGKGVQRQV